MEFVFRRSYRGPLKAVILDWAGTTVDFGSFAPTGVFLKVFEKMSVPITIEQARAPMGLMKKDHIAAITAIEEVAAAWQRTHGRPCGQEDIDFMFEQFVPLQMQCLAEYAEPIPGAVEAVTEFHARGLKVGSTTGYTREMMEILVPAAAGRGYQPDAWVCATDVPAGRPYPWMCYINAINLQVFPMEAIVKIGDTLPDIEEGLNAGMWTIGVALSGNQLGLTKEQFDRVPPQELERKRKAIYAQMYQAGAHFVVDGIWECLPTIEEIQARVSRGEKP